MRALLKSWATAAASSPARTRDCAIMTACRIRSRSSVAWPTRRNISHEATSSKPAVVATNASPLSRSIWASWSTLTARRAATAPDSQMYAPAVAA